MVATMSAAALIVGMALVSLLYRSVVTTTKQFPCLDFVKRPSTLMATNSIGQLDGKNCIYRWYFEKVSAYGFFFTFSNVTMNVWSHERPEKAALKFVVHLSCNRMSISNSEMAIVAYSSAGMFRHDKL